MISNYTHPDWEATCTIYNLNDDYEINDDDERIVDGNNAGDKEHDFDREGSISSFLVLLKEEAREIDCSISETLSGTTTCVHYLQGTISLAIQVRGTIFIRGLSQINKYKKLVPCFFYKELLEEIDAPTLSVKFQYKYCSEGSDDGDDIDPFDQNEDGPRSVQISEVRFPEASIWTLLPSLSERKEEWIKWLNLESNKVLKEHGYSYAVCQFIQYESFGFFDTVWKDDEQGKTMVVFMDSDSTEDKTNDEHHSRNNNNNDESNKVENRIHQYRDGKLAATIGSTQTATIDAGSWFSLYPRREERNNKNINENKKKNPSEKSIHDVTKNFVVSNWKKWCMVQCPICYDDIRVQDAKELIPCRHYFCYECMTMYAQTIKDDLKLQQTNPFICPIMSCSREIKIIACIKPLLSKEEMDSVRVWIKNVKNPLSTILSVCPRPIDRCGAKNSMRKTTLDSSIVYCDVCNIHWCELCLTKIKNPPQKGASTNQKIPVYNNYNSNDHYEVYDIYGNNNEGHVCDPYKVLMLCQKYRSVCSSSSSASLSSSPDMHEDANIDTNTNESIHNPNKLQQRFEKRYPWLSDYSTNRLEDIVAHQWAKENASMCPTCKTCIERSDGCFHMTCYQCKTHFCYECGIQIFPPFYGTHHCWEKEEHQQRQLEQLQQEQEQGVGYFGQGLFLL